VDTFTKILCVAAIDSILMLTSF